MSQTQFEQSGLEGKQESADRSKLGGWHCRDLQLCFLRCVCVCACVSVLQRQVWLNGNGQEQGQRQYQTDEEQRWKAIWGDRSETK